MSGALLVGGIRLPIHAPAEAALEKAKKRIKEAGLSSSGVRCRIYRRSVDARKKGKVSFVYSVAAEGAFTSKQLERAAAAGFSLLRAEAPVCRVGTVPLSCPPVVVGSGPAGLFCALLLAKHGYRPILLERGGDVAERAAATARFQRERVLDTECNIQFGAGGAGTFSDGKLVTRVNDPLCQWVLEQFVRFGAPEEILTQAKPHIGTDYLQLVVGRMLEEIAALGGEVRYHTRLTDLALQSGRLTGVQTTGGPLPAGALVLAVGNSARDTYEMLLGKGLAAQAKSFSVGVRIEHLQAQIDRAMYGDFAGDPVLGHAEYHLSYDTAHRGVYTFCMCPGGEVVAGASEEGGVVVNGMSRHARDGKNANSAVVCTVFQEDFGGDVRKAIAFQRQIEQAAYRAGGGRYAAPLCTVGDFFSRTRGSAPTEVQPTYMGGEGLTLSTPDAYLPGFITEQLRAGLQSFGRQIEGFDSPAALLTGAETRTSAPLRLLRGEDRQALGLAGVYPCGEGAGYAGGITSAAMDGVRTAMALIDRYALPGA